MDEMVDPVWTDSRMVPLQDISCHATGSPACLIAAERSDLPRFLRAGRGSPLSTTPSIIGAVGGEASRGSRPEQKDIHYRFVLLE